MPNHEIDALKRQITDSQKASAEALDRAEKFDEKNRVILTQTAIENSIKIAPDGSKNATH